MDNNNKPDASGALARPGTTSRSQIIALAALVVAVTLVYGWFSFTLTFQSNDDPAMLGIASGIFSVEGGSPRLVFQSAFLGKLYQSLFASWPGFDNYAALQLLLTTLSLLCISYTILRINHSLLVLLSILIIATVYVAPMIYFIQFTHTSMLCLIASSILLLRQVFSEKHIASVWLLALLLAVFAIAMRSANLVVVLCAVAMIAGVRVLIALSTNNVAGGGNARALAIKLLALAVFALASLFASKALQQAEQRVFYSEPEWQAFWEGHTNRAYVLENWPKWLSVEQLQTAFEQEAGLTRSEYLLMRGWLPIDREAYSLEGFEQLANITRNLAVESPGVIDRLFEANRLLMQVSLDEPILFASGALLLLLGILYATQNGSQTSAQLLNALFWMFAGYAILIGIIILYRFPPFRVTLSVTTLCMLAAIACQAYISAHYAPSTQGSRRNQGIADLLGYGALVIGMLAMNLHGYFLEYHENMWKIRDHRCKNSANELRALEDIPGAGTIFLSPNLIDSTCYIKPFDHNYPTILQERAIGFGWRNLTPWLQDRIFAEHDNLFDAICATPENTFVAPQDYHFYIANYLRQHRPQYTFKYKTNGTGSPNHLECVLRDVQNTQQP